MNIRSATIQDRDNIRTVYFSAFTKEERNIVAKLAIDLLSEKNNPPIISLVAEYNNLVVGHIAFSPIEIENDEDCQAYILAPLAVLPDHQRSRVGSKLIEYGIEQLSTRGVNIVFVYGDPKYYARFGFSTEATNNFLAPYELQYPFGWQAKIIKHHISANPPNKTICVASLSDPTLW
jgi:putative acetyltransferase